ncbi:VGL2B-like protein, partial [Mya arenaria]
MNKETDIQLLKTTLEESVNRTPAKTVNSTVPWMDMFTYTPVYGSLVAHICDMWTFYLILTCLPQYIKEVLKFDIASVFTNFIRDLQHSCIHSWYICSIGSGRSHKECELQSSAEWRIVLLIAAGV